MPGFDYQYYSKRPNELIKYLGPENVGEVNKVKVFFKKLKVSLQRKKNQAFGDRHVYNNLIAREVVQQYFENDHLADTKEEHDTRTKMLQVAEALRLRKWGQANYAFGLDIESWKRSINDKKNGSEIILDLPVKEENLKEDFEQVTNPTIAQEVDNLRDESLTLEDPVQIQTNVPNEFPLLQENLPISQKLLFNLQASSFGENSKLKGCQSSDVLAYLSKYAEAREKEGLTIPGFDTQLIQELKEAKEVLNLIDNLSVYDKSSSFLDVKEQFYDKISQSFASQQPLLIPGGWSGSPGHAIYFEMIPTSQNQATLRLYNLGAGVNNHASRSFGNKDKFIPYVDWEGIDQEHLMNPQFLQILTEMQQIENSHKLNLFSPADIYQSLYEFLKPTHVNYHEKDDYPLWMTTQHIGNCSFKSLIAFLSLKLDKDVYKCFIFEIMLQSLHDYFKNQIQDQQSLSDEDWTLIVKSSRNLENLMLELLQEGLITPNYQKQAHFCLKNINEWIETTHQSRFSQQAVSLPNHAQTSHTTSLPSSFNTMNLNKEIENPTNCELFSSPFSYVFEKVQHLEWEKPAYVIKNLTNLETICKECWLNQNDLELNSAFIHIVKSLPTDPDFWQAAVQDNPQQAQQVIELLSRLNHLFFKTCVTIPGSHRLHPARIYTLEKMLLIQTFLAGIANRKLKSLCFNLGPLYTHHYGNSSYTRNLSFRLFDGQIFKEWLVNNPDTHMSNKLKHTHKQDYYNSIKLNPEFTDGLGQASWLGQFMFSDSFKSWFHLTYDNYYSHNLFNQIREETIDHLIKLGSIKKADLPRTPGEQIAFLIKKNLFPSWIQNLNESHLYLLNLLYLPIVVSDEFDRHSDDLSFTKTGFCNPGIGVINYILKGLSDDEILKQLQMLPDGPHSINDFKEIQSRFQNTQPPFSNEFKNFHKLWRDINHQSMNEKELAIGEAIHTHFLIDPTKYGLSLSKDEFKELTHIFLKPIIQTEETLAYFSRYPGKLQQRDYQLLLRLFVFDPPAFNSILNKPEVQVHLEEFFNSFIHLTAAENHIQPLAFLLQLSRYLQNAFPDRSFPDGIPIIRSALKNPVLSLDDKSFLYAELIASLGQQTTLTEQDALDFLTAQAFLTQHPISETYKDFELQKDIDDAFIKHAAVLRDHLINKHTQAINHTLLNRVIDHYRPQNIEFETKTLQWKQKETEGHLPVFESTDGSHHYLFSPLQGRFLIDKEEYVYLPREIQENRAFCQLFPLVTQAFMTDKGIFKFNDSQGVLTLVKIVDGELLIEQKRKNKWLQWISPSKLQIASKQSDSNLIESKYLIENYQAWLSKETSTIYLYKPNSHQFNFEVKCKIQKSKLKVLAISPRQTDLRLNSKPETFSFFEDKSYIHEWWSPQNQLQEVEFPRLKLLFIMKNDKLMSEQFPGYSILPSVRIPNLGSFNHYLTLKKGNQTKILIPNLQFSKPDRKEVLKPIYEYKLKSSTQSPYFEYDVNSKGELVSTNRDACFYLACILTMHHEYATAAKLLKEFGSIHGSYSPAQIQLLEQIINIPNVTGDQDPECIGICTYASYLYLKNASLRQINVEKNKIELAVQNYQEYLSRNRKAKILKLKKSEEIFLLKYVFSDHLNSTFLFRLKELDLESYQKISASETKMSEAANLNHLTTNNAILIDPPSINLPTFFEQPKQEPTITRAHYTIYNHFGYFFNLALEAHQDPKLKAWFETAIIFMKNSNHPEGILLAPLFHDILSNPSKYQSKKLFQMDLREYNVKRLFFNVPHLPSTPLQPPKNFSTGQTTKPVSPKPSLKPVIELSTYPTYPLIDSITKFLTIRPPVKQNKQQKPITPLLNKLTEVSHPLHLQEVKTERNRLIEEFNVYQDQLAKDQRPCYQLKATSSIKEIQTHLTKLSSRIIEDLVDLEQIIVSLANVIPNSECEQAQWEAQLKGQKRQLLDLEELTIYFGQQNWEAILKRNPYIQPAELQEIAQQIQRYLCIKTQSNQIEKVLNLCEEIQSLTSKETFNDENLQDLVQRLGEEIELKRCYDPAQFPALLVFENFADFLLKEDQVKLILEFLETGNMNPLAELIMGSGKSKVLVPLLALLRAQKDVLSMVVVPESLYEEISSNVHQVFHHLFKKLIYPFKFNRETTDPKLIEMMENEINTILSKKGCLITTGSSIQSLILHFIEQAFHGDLSKDHLNSLETLRSVLALLAQKGFPLLDEVDLLLNVLYLICYSTGEKGCIPKENYELIGEIYKILYKDLHTLCYLDSDPDTNKKYPPLTETLYKDTIKPQLAQKLIESLKKSNCFSDPALAKKSQEFFSSLTQEQEKQLFNYLCHQTEGQIFFNSIQDSDIKNMIALGAMEISQLLYKTLKKKCDEKYGTCESSRMIAIPFSGPNNPDEGSQFSNICATINYTIQTIIKKGISSEILSELILNLQSQALLEVQDMPSGEKNIEKTQAWQTFNKLKDDLDLPLFKHSQAQKEELLKHLNQSLDKKMDCLIQGLLPSIEIYKKIISSNPQNLVSFFKFIQGFTGTLWNKGSLHPSLKTPEKAQGTDAKTIDILRCNSQEIKEIKGITTDELLAELYEQQEDFSLISDVGGYFNDRDNQTIARKLALKQQKKVAFFTKQGKILITDGKEEVPYSKEIDCLAFIDQINTVGANLKKARKAKGVLTIGLGTTLRDILQGAWRLRELDKQQKIQFAVNQETAALIRDFVKKEATDLISVDDILIFAIHNQAVQQGQDNFRALCQQIWNIPQMLLLKTLLNPVFNFSELKDLRKDLEELWFKDGWMPAKDLYGTIPSYQSTKEIIETQIESCSVLLEKLFAKHPILKKIASQTEMIDEVKKLKNRIHLIPEKVLVGGAIQNEDESMQLQHQSLHEIKLTTQVETEENRTAQRIKLELISREDISTTLNVREKAHLKDDFPSFQKETITAIPLDAFAQQSDELHEIHDFFEGLYAVDNAFNWEITTPRKSIKELKLLGPYRTQFAFIAFKDEDIILLSQEEAQKSKLKPCHMSLVNWKTLSKKQKTNLVKCKLLSGESSFSKNEIEYLRPILLKNPFKIQKFYLEQVLVDFPSKIKAFHSNSSLKGLFKSLQNSEK